MVSRIISVAVREGRAIDAQKEKESLHKLVVHNNSLNRPVAIGCVGHCWEQLFDNIVLCGQYPQLWVQHAKMLFVFVRHWLIASRTHHHLKTPK